MDSRDVYKYVARKIDGCTREDVKVVLDTYVDFILETLNENRDDWVILPGLGKFMVRHVPERKGISYFTKQEYCTPAHDVLNFKFKENIVKLE